jgi:hypothetical protein
MATKEKAPKNARALAEAPHPRSDPARAALELPPGTSLEVADELRSMIRSLPNIRRTEFDPAQSLMLVEAEHDLDLSTARHVFLQSLRRMRAAGLLPPRGKI